MVIVFMSLGTEPLASRDQIKYTTTVLYLQSLFVLMDKNVSKHCQMFHERKWYFLVLREKHIQMPKNSICRCDHTIKPKQTVAQSLAFLPSEGSV